MDMPGMRIGRGLVRFRQQLVVTGYHDRGFRANAGSDFHEIARFKARCHGMPVIAFSLDNEDDFFLPVIQNCFPWNYQGILFFADYDVGFGKHTRFEPAVSILDLSFESNGFCVLRDRVADVEELSGKIIVGIGGDPQ